MPSERTFSFLHAADAHLDAPVGSASPAVRERVRSAQRAAFGGLIDLALARRVDAILLAGDILDGDTLRPSTASWFPRELGRALAAGVSVVAVTGNHDASVSRLFPEGVHVVGARTPRVIEVRGDGVLAGRVFAAGHEHAAETASLVAGFPMAPADGIPAVGLVHAEVADAAGTDDHHRYAPTTLRELDRGYDYWALGHVHRRQRLPTAGEAWYAGTLQGLDLGPGEVGAKGALLVEIAHGAVAVQPVDLAPLAFRHERVTLTPRDRTLVDVMARIAAALAVPAGAAVETVCRIELAGRTPLARRELAPERLAEIAEAVAAEHGLLACTVRARDLGVVVPRDLAADQALLPGVAIALLERLRAEPGGVDELDLAPLAGAPADPEGRSAYLASLLNDLDADILSALVDGEPAEAAA